MAFHGNFFLTADLHLGHDNIISYANRPYDSVSEMNEALIQNWNETVGPGDCVWVLGDMCMGKLEKTLPMIGRLHGEKHLLPGNHDRCWIGHHGTARDLWRQRYIEAGFASVNQLNLMEIFSPHPYPSYLMSHFPYRGDHTNEDRYKNYRPKDEGKWLLHGHVHDAWLKSGRMINVGVDVWDYKPVPLEWLKEMMVE